MSFFQRARASGFTSPFLFSCLVYVTDSPSAFSLRKRCVCVYVCVCPSPLPLPSTRQTRRALARDCAPHSRARICGNATHAARTFHAFRLFFFVSSSFLCFLLSLAGWLVCVTKRRSCCSGLSPECSVAAPLLSFPFFFHFLVLFFLTWRLLSWEVPQFAFLPLAFWKRTEASLSLLPLL